MLRDSWRRSPTRLALVILFCLLAPSYGIIGLGVQRLTQACYEERHRTDPLAEPSSATTGAVDVLLWPFLILEVALSDVSCHP